MFSPRCVNDWCEKAEPNILAACGIAGTETKYRFRIRQVNGSGILQATKTPTFRAMMVATVEKARGTVGKRRSLGAGGVQL